MTRTLVVITLLGIVLVSSCNQKPNPPVDWPPMPDYGTANDAGVHE